MGFRKDAWATVWSVEEGRGNSLKVRLSVSKKNKDSGEYEQDFSGFCTFIGSAKIKGEKLQKKDRIKLGDVDVSTRYDKEKKQEYVNYKVFDFTTADDDEPSSAVSADTSVSADTGETDTEESDPF